MARVHQRAAFALCDRMAGNHLTVIDDAKLTGLCLNLNDSASGVVRHLLAFTFIANQSFAADFARQRQQRLVAQQMPFAMELFDEVFRKLESGEINALEVIEILLSEEFTYRETRRIKILLDIVKLKPITTLESFNFVF